MPLSDRQQKAQDLAREMGKMPGVAVVNPMPLDDSARGLRVQILDTARDQVIETLCGWGWLPTFLQSHPRFCPGGLKAASLYEIVIERERAAVPDRPKIPREVTELAEREAKTRANAEIEGYKKYFGWTK